MQLIHKYAASRNVAIATEVIDPNMMMAISKHCSMIRSGARDAGGNLVMPVAQAIAKAQTQEQGMEQLPVFIKNGLDGSIASTQNILQKTT